MGYAALFLAARFVGITELGTVAFAVSFTGLLTLLSDLGLNRSHTKKISEGADLQSCLSTYMLLKLMLTGVYVLLTFTVLVSLGSRIGLGYQHVETEIFVLLTIGYNIPVLISSVYVTTFLAMRDVIRAQIVSISGAFIRVVAVIVVAIFSLGLIGLVYSFVVSGIGSLLISFAVSRNSLPAISIHKISRSAVKEYSMFALPIAVAAIVGNVSTYLDKIVIQMSLDSSQTAIFYSSQSLLSPFVFLGAAIVSLVFPAISELSAQASRRPIVANLVSHGIHYLCLFVVPTTAFIMAFSRDILRLFLAPTFEAGGLAFSILALSYGLSTISMLSRAQVLGSGSARVYSRYLIAYFSLVVVLDLVLIPKQFLSMRLVGWGVNGAAAALLVAETINTILFYRQTSRTLHLAGSGKTLSMILAAIVSVFFTLSLSWVAGRFAVNDATELLVFFGLTGFYVVSFLVLAMTLKSTSVNEIKTLVCMLARRHVVTPRLSNEER